MNNSKTKILCPDLQDQDPQMWVRACWTNLFIEFSVEELGSFCQQLFKGPAVTRGTKQMRCHPTKFRLPRTFASPVLIKTTANHPYFGTATIIESFKRAVYGVILRILRPAASINSSHCWFVRSFEPRAAIIIRSICVACQ